MRLTVRQEQGSMPFALLVAIVVSGLIVVLVATVLTSQRTVRFDRSFTNVIQGADAGVQEALHQLNAGLLVLDIGVTAPTVTTEVNGIAIEWTLTRESARFYEVVSTGELDGVERTVVATIEAVPLFYSGAFGDHLVALQGTSTFVDSYESDTEVCPTPAQPDTCWGTDPDFGTGTGTLGTNEDYDFAGKTVVKTAVLYDWLANPGANPTAEYPGGDRCSSPPGADPNLCGPEVIRLEDDRLDYASDDKMAFIYDKLEACGDGREMGQLVLGGKAGPDTYPDELEPYSTASGDNQGTPAEDDWGNYYCADSLEFVGDTTFPGASSDTPVVIFVRDFVKVSKPQARVNCPDCKNSGGDGYWRDVRPVASSLQIYVASDSEEAGGNVFIKAGGVFAGVLYAPRARCGADPGDGGGGGGGAGVDLYGSLICRTIDQVGNWKFHWDEALHDLARAEFDVTYWREE